jgi:hypothetical protein
VDEPDELDGEELVDDDESLELDEPEPFEESEPLGELDDVLDESAVVVEELFEPRLSFL